MRPDELAAENLLLLNVGHCFRDQVLDACHEFSRPPVQGKEGNSLETIRNMVTSGMGISVLPATALTPKYAMPLVKAIDSLRRHRRAASSSRAATAFRAPRRWRRSSPSSRGSRCRSSPPDCRPLR